MPKAASKKKAANGYKLAEPLPAGEILEDVAKKKWKLGPSIGQGGFGEIYSAQEAGTSGAKYPYVVKIEPHANGPLFVEMHFYIKNAKPEDVEAFKSQKGLKTFGMPVYLGSGSHEFNGEKYRFIVMEKFGTDLWNIFLENNRHFPTSTVFKVAVQVLDVLEYIHSKGYVHADIKGANILLGVTKTTQNKQVYLVDFGLAAKCNEEEEFKANPKKAHDGTIEYLSRDSHNGVQTKRGDLETLAYNLIQWLGCVLPWEQNLKNPSEVQKVKEEYMSNVPKFIKACFDKRSPPGPVVDFLNSLSTLDHNSNPDYKTIRKIFLSGLSSGDTLAKPFKFSVPDKTSPKKSPVKRKIEDKPAAASSRKKQAKVEKEESEDEKENFDDLSDTEESTKKVVKKRGKDKANATKPKEKKKTNSKKRAKKELPEKEEDDVDEDHQAEIEDNHHVSDDEEIDNVNKKNRRAVDHSELKEKAKGRKKAAKGRGLERMPDEDDEERSSERQQTVPDIIEPPTRSTRQRGRPVNYKEDSDDEKKPSRKKPKTTLNSREVHVTGDSGDSGNEGYTSAVKQVAKKKVQNGKSKKKSESKKTVAEKEKVELDEKEQESKKTAARKGKTDVDKEQETDEEVDSASSEADDEVTKTSRDEESLDDTSTF